MRSAVLAFPLVVLFLVATPVLAQEDQKPEAVVEKMAFKLVRGVTNFATAPAELPKQTYLSVRDRGPIGYAIGPIKGIGMTLYRGLIGTVETVFFLVPQPGYYDPMIDPEYVWHGWEARRGDQARQQQTETVAVGGKGE